MPYTDVIKELEAKQKQLKANRKRAKAESIELQNLTKSTQVVMHLCPKCQKMQDLTVNMQPNKELSHWIWSWITWSV